MADGLLTEDWLGPVDFLVAELPATGVPQGVRALLGLVDAGTVRVLDLEVVTVTADGVLGTPLPAWGDEAGLDLHEFDGAFSGLLDEDDLVEATTGLTAGTSALVLVYEVLSVRPLVEALLADGARVLAEGPVGPLELVAALDEFDTSKEG